MSELYRMIAVAGGMLGLCLVVIGLFLGMIALFGPKAAKRG